MIVCRYCGKEFFDWREHLTHMCDIKYKIFLNPKLDWANPPSVRKGEGGLFVSGRKCRFCGKPLHSKKNKLMVCTSCFLTRRKMECKNKELKGECKK